MHSISTKTWFCANSMGLGRHDHRDRTTLSHAISRYSGRHESFNNMEPSFFAFCLPAYLPFPACAHARARALQLRTPVLRVSAADNIRCGTSALSFDSYGFSLTVGWDLPGSNFSWFLPFCMSLPSSHVSCILRLCLSSPSHPHASLQFPTHAFYPPPAAPTTFPNTRVCCYHAAYLIVRQTNSTTCLLSPSAVLPSCGILPQLSPPCALLVFLCLFCRGVVVLGVYWRRQDSGAAAATPRAPRHAVRAFPFSPYRAVLSALSGDYLHLPAMGDKKTRTNRTSTYISSGGGGDAS